MVQGIGNGFSNSTGKNLFQTNQANASQGKYKNIAGPNDVYNKTAALTLNTVKTLNQGLVNALNQSVANLNQNTQANQNNGTANNGGIQYNNNGKLTVGVNQTGNVLSKIV